MSKKSPGEQLVEAIVGGLPPGVELDERESALLGQASKLADLLEQLEDDIAEQGLRVEGSRPGHTVLNPSIAELRQSRLAMGKLLGALDLPESTRDAVRTARHAAEARWRQTG